MKALLPVIAALLLFSQVSLPAERSSTFEIFGGYSHQWVDDRGGYGQHGWNAAIAGNVNSWLAVVADGSGYHWSPYPAGFSMFDSSRFALLFGPSFTCRCSRDQRITPFFHLLAGMSRESYSILDTSYADSAMAYSIGGGGDLRLNGRFAVRVIQMDFLRTKLAGRWLNNGRISLGIVWRFGRK
jgi:hypothetical protein